MSCSEAGVLTGATSILSRDSLGFMAMALSMVYTSCFICWLWFFVFCIPGRRMTTCLFLKSIRPRRNTLPVSNSSAMSVHLMLSGFISALQSR